MSGDATIFRQWRQNFTTTLGPVKGGHEQVVHKKVREMHVAKESGSMLDEGMGQS